MTHAKNEKDVEFMKKPDTLPSGMGWASLSLCVYLDNAFRINIDHK